MGKSKTNPQRFDPYKNFKFRIAKIVPEATRHDVRLTGTELELLDQIVANGRSRNVTDGESNTGAHALFAGEKGTGKSKAGEVVAKQLGQSLYRIDLAEVINKYIEETAKNLDRLLDLAEETGAILYFDEADALFGKRSDVKDSHDRYANVEIEHLLQRMETHNGLMIFATNRKKDLDEAFLRRLPFVIEFPPKQEN